MRRLSPLRFVQVLGQPGSSREPGWVLPVGVHRLEKGCPGVVQLQEHLIGHLGGERLVGICGFDRMKDGRVREVALLKDEGLPDMIVGEIP